MKNNAKREPHDASRPAALRRRLLPMLVTACFAGNALANPLGPQVVNGQVGFSNQGNVLSITNTPGSIINWQSFSINPGEIARFIQQNPNSAVLNRVVGQDPSQILGALQSNGRVFLINPNGILFGQGAQVDVNGLVASTLNISNEDFLKGQLNFRAGDRAGSLKNQGSITTPNGGQVFLIAPNVENSGIITSPKGDVLLAAGRSVQMVDSMNPDLHVVISAPADEALNLGQVIANSGRTGIYGALVKQRGIVNANSAVIGENGKVVLKASGDTLLEAGSRTTATGAGTGGEVHVLGNRVALTGDAKIDASGQAGGGTVLVGGDYQGKNGSIQNATVTYAGKDTEIRADATVNGNGGKVIVWADDTTRAHGAISAQGGPNGGNGGLVETSGHRYLDVGGIRVNANGAAGGSGQWLLDPNNITIVSGAAGTPTNLAESPSGVFSTTGDTAQITNGTITQALDAGTSVSLTTGAAGTNAESGNISINAPISTSTASGNVSLSMTAHGAINVNDAITNTGSNQLNVSLSGIGTASNTSGIRLTSATINAGTGTVTLTGTGYSVGTGGVGVELQQSSILANGGIAINGTGHGTSSSMHGILVDGKGAAGYSLKSDGGISLAGTTDATGGVAVGTLLTNGAHVETTGTGNISITGAGGPGSGNNHGVLINGSSTSTSKVFAADGNIVINGTAGDTHISSMGVGIGGFDSYIEATGNGSVAITGNLPAGGGGKGFNLYSSTPNGIRTNNGAITISATNIYLDTGTINAGSGTVGLTSTTGGIQQAGAPINAGRLDINSGESVNLVNVANSISALSALTTNGLAQTFAIKTSGGLQIVEAPTLPGHGIDVGNVTGSKVTLDTGGSVTQLASAPIRTDQLLVKSPGSVVLNTAMNEVGSLAASINGSGTESLRFTNSGPLTITSIDGVSGITIANFPNYTPGSSSGVIALEATGNITQTSAGRLGGAAVWVKSTGGMVDLTTATGGNPTGMLAGSANTGFDYKSSNPIVVTDVDGKKNVSAGTVLSLTSPSSIDTYSATLSATPTVNLTAGDGINVVASNVSSINVVNGTVGSPANKGVSITSTSDGDAGLSVSVDQKIGTPSPGYTDIKITHDGAITVAGPGVLSSNAAGNSGGDIYIRSEGPNANGASKVVATNAAPIKTLGVGEISITADEVSFNGAASVSADSTTGSVNVRAFTANAPSWQIVDGTQYSCGTLPCYAMTSLNNISANALFLGADDGSVTGNLSLEGPVTFNTPLVGLGTGGYVSKNNAGVITAGTLGVLAGGAIYLGETTQAANSVTKFAAKSSAGVLSFKNDKTFTVPSTIVHPDAPWSSAVTASGDITLSTVGASDVVINGSVVSTGGKATLDSAGTILQGQSTSQIKAATELTLIADSVSLGGSISVGSGTAGGHLAIKQKTPMRDIEIGGATPTAGKLNLTQTDLAAIKQTGLTGGAVLIGDSTGAIDFKGTYQIPGNMFTNLYGTTVNQTAGAAIHGSLHVNASDAVNLSDSSNRITDFIFTSPSSVAMTTSVLSLYLSGNSSAGGGFNIANNGGDITVYSGQLYASSNSAALTASGGISIVASSADASVMGAPDVNLTLGGNLSFTSTGAYKAFVSSGAPATTHLTFTNSTSKVLFNGVQAAATTSGDMGFFYAGAPGSGGVAAVAGTNIVLSGGDTGNFTVPTVPAGSGGSGSTNTPTLDQCTANPTLAGCSNVLPTLSACTTDPTQAGCSTVLPPLDTCTTNPTQAGCTAVLPSLTTCTTNPTQAGCTAVLPTLASCTTTPTLPGCTAVLPSVDQCKSAPATPGCSAVPTMTSCTANPQLAGCATVLPTLETCTANPTQAGCTVVLPTLSACTTNPTQAGCTAVLPPLSSCTTNPTLAGCSAVLPSIDACATNPSQPGCTVVLPTLTACTTNPAQAGCTAVLPSLSSCTANPTQAGCTAVLPTAEQCLSNSSLAGCSTVITTASRCLKDPTLPECQPVLSPNTPPSAPVTQTSPVAAVENTVIQYVNTTNTSSPFGSNSQPSGSSPSTASRGASSSSSAPSENKQDGKDDAKGDKKTTAGPDDSGVKKNEPAKKMYCN